jgi:hypothetical protein
VGASRRQARAERTRARLRTDAEAPDRRRSGVFVLDLADRADGDRRIVKSKARRGPASAG